MNGGSVDETSDPVSVSGLTDAVGIAADGFQSCAVLADGHIRCWGSDLDAVLGDDDLRSFQGGPVEVSGVADAVAITLGGFHGCALRADGTVACWGVNTGFELGNESAGDFPKAPVAVEGLSNVVSLSAGSHTCAVIADGTVWCWGSNTDGELGSGVKSRRELPTQVRGLAAAESVAVGQGTSCAVLRDHTVRCWGRNTYGALGNGTTQDSLSPVTVLER